MKTINPTAHILYDVMIVFRCERWNELRRTHSYDDTFNSTTRLCSHIATADIVSCCPILIILPSAVCGKLLQCKTRTKYITFTF